MASVSRLLSGALGGIEAVPVFVEANLSRTGDPQTVVVGLPDSSVKESRDRVATALANSGFDPYRGRVTVNLAPADLKKEGSHFDLPIALAILLAAGEEDGVFSPRGRSAPPAGAPPAKSAKADTLYNLSQPLSRTGQGTHAYCARGRKEWKMLDQILASAPLLRPTSPLVCDPASFEIVRPPCMLERHGWRKGVPIPTFQGEGRYRGGFSDHLPVAVRLNDGR